MTIRHLNIFLAVAEYGTMSAAAEHLYLSQPTVSQAVRELEQHYHCLLFERLGMKDCCLTNPRRWSCSSGSWRKFCGIRDRHRC